MRVGTRGSRLALAQTELFIRSLRGSDPLADPEVRVVSTRGDRDLETPLGAFGGYGVFVKELDAKLLKGEIDVSVNSLKDMPARPGAGTTVAALLPRANPADCLLPGPLESLPEGARVGSSSVRRAALLRMLRPDLEILPLRGNVETRISKLQSGDYDGIVLAQAGLDRLGLDPRRQELPVDLFVPAAGQGAIAIVCREDDEGAIRSLSPLDHGPTRLCVDLERALLRELEAGCSAPIGAHATVEGGGLRLRALAFSPDGGESRRFDGILPLDYGGELPRVAEALREVLP